MPIKTSSDTTITKIYGNTTGKIQTQSKVPPIDFHAKTGLAVEYSISGNMTQASTQEYSITDIPPIDFQSDGSVLTAWSIAGNMTQTGTPKPDAPIMPEFVGVRTGNLWDENYPNISGTLRYIPIYVGEGSFTLSTTTPYDSSVANLFLLSGNVSTGASTAGNGAWLKHNVTAQSDSGYVTIAYRQYTGTTSPADCKTMLNLGSTALPYEPFGYKIPITNAGQTVMAYLTEPICKIGDYADLVDSSGVVTRRIKKLVLDGTENWQKSSAYKGSFYAQEITNYLSLSYDAYCTHAVHVPTLSQYSKGKMVFNGGITGNCNLWFGQFDENTTVADFKSYLAAQYAAGTPVTVWYVLATPTTETITSPTISTVSGANTLSIGTTLQPSNVSLTTTSSVYPLNPIIPEEVGDKTGNLLSEKYESRSINGAGAFVIDSDFDLWIGEVVAGQTYTISNIAAVYGFFTAKPLANTGVTYDGSREIESSGTAVVTIPSGCTWIAVRVLHNADNAMLNSGSTALPYEPFGYKIPLNLNNTISNIYLSQPIRKIGNYSDSIDYENGTVTRNIKKLVLTGQETPYYYPFSGTNGFAVAGVLDTNYTRASGICTHYPVKPLSLNNTLWIGVDNKNIYFVGIGDVLGTAEVSDFKAWLASEYAAGHPVTIWYVLSTPEVEQITPPTITPSIESNTISVDTTLQPSNLSITYTSPDYSEIKLVYDNLGNLVYRTEE